MTNLNSNSNWLINDFRVLGYGGAWSEDDKGEDDESIPFIGDHERESWPDPDPEPEPEPEPDDFIGKKREREREPWSDSGEPDSEEGEEEREFEWGS